EAISDRLTFRTGWVVLVLLLIGYFSADPLGVPLSAVAGTGAVILVAVAARRPAFLFPQRVRHPLPATVGAANAEVTAEHPARDRAAHGTAGEDTTTSGSDTTTSVGGPATPASWREGHPGGPRRIPVGKVIREAPWQIVLLSIGMYLVVYGLRNQGLTG